MIDKIYNDYNFQYPIRASLNLTNDCNFTCRYCFVEQKPQYMTLDVAKKVVDWLLENQHIQKTALPVTCYFFGGEPLLCWDSIIVPLIKYVNENYKNPNIQYGMTTNGLLLTKEKIIFCHENNIHILVSIDGAETTQNYNRKTKNPNINGFQTIKNNLKILQQYQSVEVRPTIYADTVEHTFENYLFFLEQGIDKIFFGVDASSKEWNQEQKLILKEQINSICYYNLTHLEHFFSCLNLNRWIYGIFANFQDIQNNALQCGLGIESVGITPSGDIAACQEFSSWIQSKEDLGFLGNVFNGGIDINYHKKFILKALKQDWECNKSKMSDTCIIPYNICNRYGCIAGSQLVFNNLYTKAEMNCYYQNLFYKNALLINKILLDSNQLKSNKIKEAIATNINNNERF